MNTVRKQEANRDKEKEEMKQDEPEGELITQDTLGVPMVTTKEYENMIDKYAMYIDDEMRFDDMAMFAMTMNYDNVDPKTYKDIFNCPQKYEEA
jgi:hypothetical protein